MSEKFNPRELEFDVKHCEPEEMCLECATSALSYSPAGIALRSMEPRFGTWMWEDRERMKQFLPDTDPLMHGPNQAQTVALPMIEFQNAFGYRRFSRAEAKLLYLTHVFHDAHEGVWAQRLGMSHDIAKPQKTRENDILELALNREIVSNILRVEPDHPLIEGMQNVMGDFDGQTFLGRAFTAIEYAGYCENGLRAWALRNHNDLDHQEREMCEQMGRVVVTADVPKLEKYAVEFPYIAMYLDRIRVAERQMR